MSFWDACLGSNFDDPGAGPPCGDTIGEGLCFSYIIEVARGPQNRCFGDHFWCLFGPKGALCGLFWGPFWCLLGLKGLFGFSAQGKIATWARLRVFSGPILVPFWAQGTLGVSAQGKIAAWAQLVRGGPVSTGLRGRGPRYVRARLSQGPVLASPS